MLNPSVPLTNPFSHDRKRTYQPRDLWESLLKCVILLFVIDVGVRRIQLDRDEMRRAWRVVRHWLMPWAAQPRAPEAEESLAALLARREQVRSHQTAPAVQPSPDLFRPEKPVTEPLVMTDLPGVATAEPEPPPLESAAPPAKESPPSSTTSRLLEAKRRAQRRRD